MADRAIGFGVATLVVTGALAVVVLAFRRLWRRPSRVRRLAARFSLAAFSTLYVLLALEAVFRFAVDKSDSFGFTLGSRAWFQRHWRPVNSLGYRDRERDLGDLAGKRILFVAGDSFVAGHGIEDIRDRFPDRIESLMGDPWVVLAVAQPGWGTRDEYLAIRSHPASPDAIVYSYVLNDVEGAAESVGFPRPRLVEPPPRALAPLVSRSYLADFAYWRLYRFRNQHLTRDYWDYLRECHAREDVWKVHEQEILDVVHYARAAQIRLVGLVWPYLVDVEASRPFTSRVARLLESAGVPVVDMTAVLSGRDPTELVVNSMDAHPNEEVHALAAKRLFEVLSSGGR
ncbi:MAG: SGNH/GDSL hydrolase family protein [Planctomycetes bacterium]|nr:SGNH/GDSL hydrolase family protein [Planctomycetota bacterium]